MRPNPLIPCLCLCFAAGLTACAEPMPRIRVSDDRSGFVRESTGGRFTPWGFNYDHDEDGTLLEDYWLDDWPRVEGDFAEMKQLGANVVRVHLQFGRFMLAPDEPNNASLDQLERLLRLAERTGLYLDLTGLGCYHKQDVPPWYDPLSEEERWAAQAKFWEAVASRCKNSPAVFCYDLMNEPVVPGKGKRDDWLGGAFAGKHFVQFISLDIGDRPRHVVAKQWIDTLVAAIRRHDKRGLITVGMVDWSLDRPGLSSGFIPDKVAENLDFIAVHIYPETGKLDEAIDTLKGFNIGKPVVIEETFPLKAGVNEFAEFVERSRPHAAGWIGFYWGKPPEEMRPPKTIPDAMMLGYLDYFASRAAAMTQ